jgi:hypothetical protein
MINLNDVLRVCESSLTFTDQKNAVRGESIGHLLSGHHVFCPTLSLARRTYHLCTHCAINTTQLYTVYEARKLDPTYITTTDIMAALHQAASNVQHLTGVDPECITVQCGYSYCIVRSSGALGPTGPPSSSQSRRSSRCWRKIMLNNQHDTTNQAISTELFYLPSISKLVREREITSFAKK